MSERIYARLLRLFPPHFRQAYGGAMLQLVRDRARDETGFFPRLRLWLDLVADLAVSLPRLPRSLQPALMAASVPQSLAALPSFHLLETESLRPSALLSGGALSLLTFVACAIFIAHAGMRHPFHAPDNSAAQPALPAFTGSAALPGPPLRSAATALLSAAALTAQDPADSSPHTIQFVTVAKDVKLEVLDWGGSGRPVIFLAGMGSNAHVFDQFAPKFAPRYHVYGITRRGFGASSKPAPTVANYSAVRLGDDVLAVIDALQLHRPVLAGHSIAGQELSSVGSRHPEKVAGLIYLDAGYGYAFYDPAHGDVWLDMIDLRNRIDQLQSGAAPDRKALWQGMLADTARLERAMRQITKDMESMPNFPPPPPVARAIQFGGQKYTEIPVPILAIFAIRSADDPHTIEQANAFEAGLPSAHVVRLQHSDHFVFRSNEADVLREMNAFLARLP